MDKIVFASNNKDKWLELVEDFKKQNIELILSEKHLDLEEDEMTLVSNSFSKAKSAARATGMMALGDDSGIAIDALDWFPGVYSRRWYGTPADDIGRCAKILELMEGEKNRTVYLVSRFILTDENGNRIFSTAVRNQFKLAEKIEGNHGFGYDRILIPIWSNVFKAAEEGRISLERAKEIAESNSSIGMLSQEEKNAINNRGRIALEIRNFLDSRF